MNNKLDDSELTDEVWKTEVINGMTVKTCDLNKINKIEFKSKLEPSSEEKLKKALEWIEDHKRKSGKHDFILKMIAIVEAIMLPPIMLAYFSAAILNIFSSVFLTTVSLFCIAISVGFCYYMIRKVQKANE